MLATPANPTGTSIEPAELQAVLDLVRQRHGALVVDEIYLGLSFDPHSQVRHALAHRLHHPRALHAQAGRQRQRVEPDPYYVLPLVMTLTTVIQTALNPLPPDPLKPS